MWKWWWRRWWRWHHPQVMACEERVGWREQSRRIIVLETDRDFHMAGGQVAGGQVARWPGGQVAGRQVARKK